TRLHSRRRPFRLTIPLCRLEDTPMLRRTIGLLITLVLSILVAPIAGGAPPRAKPARLAVLRVGSASALPLVVAGFQQGLRELGWVEGKNLTIEWGWAEGSLDRFATLVEEMVRLPVEVLVVPNATTAEIAQRVTPTMPIVVIDA